MNHSIKIIWNEAAFIDLDGKSGRVAHTGIKYIDRNASQPPSVIPASASVSDFAIPTDRIYYQQEYYNRYYSRSS